MLVCALQVVHQPWRVVSKLGVLRFFGGTQWVGEEGGGCGGGGGAGARGRGAGGGGGLGLIATN